MKFFIAYLILSITLISCKKDTPPSSTTDYRSEITGEYNGIRIWTTWNNAEFKWNRDSANVVVTLSPSSQDSIVNIYFSPSYSTTQYSFKYANEQFYSIVTYHPPTLTVNNDSLYFRHTGGLAPNTYECFAIKNEP